MTSTDEEQGTPRAVDDATATQGPVIRQPRRLHPSSLMVCRGARLRRRRCNHVIFVLGVAAIAYCCRGWTAGVRAIELTIDPDMVQNMQSANETAERFSSTDYVDLTCKVRLVVQYYNAISLVRDHST